jgi:nucleotide-binding universal stress UspA family protein
MYKKALVPLDGSELAECTLNHLKNLIKDGSVGEVTLLNVVKVDIPLLVNEDEVKHINIGKIREMAFQLSKKYLANIESRLGTEGIKVKTESMESPRPAHAIIEYAQKNDMDMIVIATHGYTGMKGMLMGSVAFGVIHQSHVPVLLIRPESCQV